MTGLTGLKKIEKNGKKQTEITTEAQKDGNTEKRTKKDKGKMGKEKKKGKRRNERKKENNHR